MRQSRVTFVVAIVAVTVVATTASAIDSPQTFTLLEVSLPRTDRPLGGLLVRSTARSRRPLRHDECPLQTERSKARRTRRPSPGDAHLRDRLRSGLLPQVSPDGPSRITFPVIGARASTPTQAGT